MKKQIIDLDKIRKEELIEKIRQCDGLHNRCDYLLEHNDCDDIIEYFDDLKKENEKLKIENVYFQSVLLAYNKRGEKMNKDITLEDLGYEKTIDANNLLVYEIKNSITDTDKLVFYKNLKNFEMYTQSDSPFETLHPQNITVKELQAIYNKCKELGWFDED